MEIEGNWLFKVRQANDQIGDHISLLRHPASDNELLYRIEKLSSRVVSSLELVLVTWLVRYVICITSQLGISWRFYLINTDFQSNYFSVRAYFDFTYSILLAFCFISEGASVRIFPVCSQSGPYFFSSRL